MCGRLAYRVKDGDEELHEALEVGAVEGGVVVPRWQIRASAGGLAGVLR
jgi:hypothetical protein